jgi:hypothetical protein
METIYFLIFVGVCACAVVWATRNTKKKTNLAARNKARQAKMSSDKLATPADARLAHKRQIWEARKHLVTEGYDGRQSFIPKSVAGGDPEYDGYSRRDRHHLTRSGHVKEEAHIDDRVELAKTRIKFESEKHSTQI